jgi:hypothetical protein
MRRLLVSALAAPSVVLLAAACGQAPCGPPTLTVAWTFDLPTGLSGQSCAAAQVETVDVWVDGQHLGVSRPCSDGRATFRDVQGGSHQVRVEGRDAGGALVNRAEFSRPSAACDDTLVTARPGQGWLNVDYRTPTGTCDPSFLWYALAWAPRQDPTAQVVVSELGASSADPHLLACGATLEFKPIPYGTYRLLHIENVVEVAGTTSTQFAYCGPALERAVTGIGQSDLIVDLVARGGALCP